FETRAAPEGGSGGVTVTAAARATVRLAMVTGLFNLLWAAVTVLMIVRPGSTTGA
ncbi:protease, partial [Streptomyces carpinensis]